MRSRASSPPAGLADTGRQAGEIGFIVLGMALVVIVGGIDLSVGSMFALCDFCALFCLNVLDWPVPAVIVATLICGAALGAVNGLLIGYLRLRAFITTLITLIIYRSAYDLLLFDYSNTIAAAFPDFPSWNFIGGGVVAGVPSVVLVYIVVAIFGHVFLTRLRPGWHVTAIGGSRRSAYNSGIPVRRTIALCYTASGVLTSIGALFFAARLGTVGGDVGVGLEVTVLTATVLGGISLGGGKGSVAKALVGTLIVLFVINGLTTLSVSGRRQPHGAGRRAAGRRHHRYPLAEEPQPHHLARSMSARPIMRWRRRPRPRPAAARSRRTTSCAT